MVEASQIEGSGKVGGGRGGLHSLSPYVERDMKDELREVTLQAPSAAQRTHIHVPLSFPTSRDEQAVSK